MGVCYIRYAETVRSNKVTWWCRDDAVRVYDRLVSTGGVFPLSTCSAGVDPAIDVTGTVSTYVAVIPISKATLDTTNHWIVSFVTFDQNFLVVPRVCWSAFTALCVCVVLVLIILVVWAVQALILNWIKQLSWPTCPPCGGVGKTAHGNKDNCKISSKSHCGSWSENKTKQNCISEILATKARHSRRVSNPDYDCNNKAKRSLTEHSIIWT